MKRLSHRTKVDASLAAVHQSSVGDIYLTWPEFIDSTEKGRERQELELGAVQ